MYLAELYLRLGEQAYLLVIVKVRELVIKT